jgi:hypothetical protein
MTPCRLVNLLLLGAIVVMLRTMQRTPKCPHCAARAGREWYGQVGYCKNETCGKAFRV